MISASKKEKIKSGYALWSPTPTTTTGFCYVVADADDHHRFCSLLADADADDHHLFCSLPVIIDFEKHASPENMEEEEEFCRLSSPENMEVRRRMRLQR